MRDGRRGRGDLHASAHTSRRVEAFSKRRSGVAALRTTRSPRVNALGRRAAIRGHLRAEAKGPKRVKRRTPPCSRSTRSEAAAHNSRQNFRPPAQQPSRPAPLFTQIRRARALCSTLEWTRRKTERRQLEPERVDGKTNAYLYERAGLFATPMSQELEICIRTWLGVLLTVSFSVPTGSSLPVAALSRRFCGTVLNAAMVPGAAAGLAVMNRRGALPTTRPSDRPWLCGAVASWHRHRKGWRYPESGHYNHSRH